MDEETQAQLKQIYTSLRVLSETMAHNMAWNVHKGTGGIVVRSYRTLHAKVAQFFPDDPYIVEGLAFDLPPDASDSQQIGSANLLINQLLVYLRGLMADETDEQTEKRKMKRKLRYVMDNHEESE